MLLCKEFFFPHFWYMDTHYLTGELQRAAKFDYIRLPAVEEKNYKGVPQVDLSVLRTMDTFHAQPANSVDQSEYVRYPAEKVEDFLGEAPVYNVKQTESIHPANTDESRFMNTVDPTGEEEKAPRPSIGGQTILM